MALLDARLGEGSAGGVGDAVIAVAWATGLRWSELAGLLHDDFVQTGAEEKDLRMRGKGDKVRVVYL